VLALRTCHPTPPVAFPSNWGAAFENQEVEIIGPYGVGVLVIALGGVFVPILSGPREGQEAAEDAGGKHCWRLRHRNGNVMADSGEGSSERNSAERALHGVKRNAPNADVEDVSE